MHEMENDHETWRLAENVPRDLIKEKKNIYLYNKPKLKNELKKIVYLDL